MTSKLDRLLDLDALVGAARCGVVRSASPGALLIDVEDAEPGPVEARALRGAADAAAGDEVLVVRASGGRWFVVGVVAKGAAAEAPSRVATADGVSASVAREGDAEVLAVRDASGRVLFEHRPGEGRTVVSVPDGDLEFAAPAGRIALRAARGVGIETGGDVDVRGDGAVRLAAGRAGEPGGAAVRLDAGAAEITATALRTVAARAVLHLRDVELVAATAESTIETLRTVAGLVETKAQRVVERARNVYREVENLAQTRAGRIRLVARDAIHAAAPRAHVAAEQDLTLKGEKVYIG